MVLVKHGFTCIVIPMSTTQKHKPTFTTEVIEIAGEQTTVIHWDGDMEFGDENCCSICGLKVRGKHSYIVHLSVNGYLLPVDQHTDNYSVTQGFFSVGSECRKQLPATHSMKDTWGN